MWPLPVPLAPWRQQDYLEAVFSEPLWGALGLCWGAAEQAEVVRLRLRSPEE